MTMKEAIREVLAEMGFVGAEEIHLRSGETVFLLTQPEGAKTGLPMYLHDVDGIPMMSTYEESMALFSEPDYMREG